jgi:hypothetical protein
MPLISSFFVWQPSVKFAAALETGKVRHFFTFRHQVQRLAIFVRLILMCCLVIFLRIIVVCTGIEVLKMILYP